MRRHHHCRERFDCDYGNSAVSGNSDGSTSSAALPQTVGCSRAADAVGCFQRGAVSSGGLVSAHSFLSGELGGPPAWGLQGPIRQDTVVATTVRSLDALGPFLKYLLTTRSSARRLRHQGRGEDRGPSNSLCEPPCRISSVVMIHQSSPSDTRFRNLDVEATSLFRSCLDL